MNYTKGEWAIAFEADCGCIIKRKEERGIESVRIEYCPKHKAALEMYQALLSALGSLMVFDNPEYPWVKGIMNNIQKVVAKAKGKANA